MRIKRWALATAAVAMFAACDSGSLPISDDDDSAPTDDPTQSTAVPLQYKRSLVTDTAGGPAFVEVADINGDGRHDLVVSSFGQIAFPDLPAGAVTVYEQGASLEEWTAKPVFTADAGIYWPNHLTVHDVDADGDLDILLGSGFLVCSMVPTLGQCGGIIWFEQDAGQWMRHDIIPPQAELFYHSAQLADLNGDGRLDLLTVGEYTPMPGMGGMPRAEVQWFEGTADAARFSSTPHAIGQGLGSLPQLFDVDADGDLDIVSAEFFAGMGASFSWFEQTVAPSPDTPAGQWQRHVIDDASGPAIQMSIVPGLLGDDRWFAVGTNHTNTAAENPDLAESAVMLFEPGADPRQPWTKTQISKNIVSAPGSATSPQAAPGIFGWGDADNDGDHDLLVSGDGDPRVFLLEHTSPGVFKTWVLDDGISQAGGMKLADLNGDGLNEAVVTGYDANVIYLYTLSDSGSYPLGEALPPAGSGSGSTNNVVFDVAYDGGVSGDLIIALFETFPPTGPPSKFTTETNPTFPVTISLEDVEPGEYTAMLFIDAEPLNPAMPGPEDVQTTVAISVPMDAESIAVTLQP